MTDIFTRLAERVLGEAPLAHPVIAPAFSPDPGVTGEFVESADWVEPQSSERTAPAAPILQPLRTPRTPVLVDGAQSPSAEQANRSFESDLPSQTQPSDPASLDIPPENQRVVNAQDSSLQIHPPNEAAWVQPAQGTPEPSKGFHAPPGSVARQVILVPVARDGKPAVSMPLEAPRAQPEITLPSDTQAGSDTPSPRLMPRVTKVPARGLVSPASQSESQVTTPAADSPWSVSSDDSGTKVPSEPVIRVTIGRVEVRLVQAPAPIPVNRAPARSIPAPALSLDEYLKQRDEGKR